MVVGGVAVQAGVADELGRQRCGGLGGPIELEEAVVERQAAVLEVLQVGHDGVGDDQLLAPADRGGADRVGDLVAPGQRPELIPALARGLHEGHADVVDGQRVGAQRAGGMPRAVCAGGPAGVQGLVALVGEEVDASCAPSGVDEGHQLAFDEASEDVAGPARAGLRGVQVVQLAGGQQPVGGEALHHRPGHRRQRRNRAHRRTSPESIRCPIGGRAAGASSSWCSRWRRMRAAWPSIAPSRSSSGWRPAV